jgi:hypothetical protein
MDDLNLIFLIKNKIILSWSAGSGKFQNNNIEIPENATIVSARCYLTYIYLVDSTNNQIYRYPRADGGFGAKTDWFRDSVSLSSMKDTALNENLYATDGKNITKLFRGKKQDFAISETTTPIKPDRIFTKTDSQNLYVLDKENSRIISLDQTGNILKQYYNADIPSFRNFSVDEKNSVIYLGNESGVKSFIMNF